MKLLRRMSVIVLATLCDIVILFNTSPIGKLTNIQWGNYIFEIVGAVGTYIILVGIWGLIILRWEDLEE